MNTSRTFNPLATTPATTCADVHTRCVGDEFLLIVTPREPNRFATFEAFSEWFIENRGSVDRWILQYGAVAFRNFVIESAEQLEALFGNWRKRSAGNTAGSSPRAVVQGKVYESTRVHPSASI